MLKCTAGTSSPHLTGTTFGRSWAWAHPPVPRSVRMAERGPVPAADHRPTTSSTATSRRGTGRTLGFAVLAALGVAFAAVIALVALVALVAGAGVASPGSSGPGGTTGAAGWTGGRVPTIPPPMLALYLAATTTCPGLPWSVLAAIGTVESDNGQSSLPGVHSGANAAGAEGPMQFEPSTFAAYALPVPPGGELPPSPYDATDAVYAAARMLCADGARNGADLPAAVFAYDHSTSYVITVLSLAGALQAHGTG